jgi:isocitrate dehydrogenase
MTDHWRCRFQSPGELEISHAQLIRLLERAHQAGFDVVKTENLYMFDGERGYSVGAGE